MPQTPWLALAKNLRIGRRIKTQHCGVDRSALVSHNDSGYSLHCFRCGASSFEPHGERGLSEIMATRRADAVLGSAATMPDDVTTMMAAPTAAIRWVLAGGLSPEDANDQYGFRWSADANRVLIPLEEGLLGRCVHGSRPKYRLYGKGGVYALPGAGDGDRATVVVEDILSAIAIHRAGWPAVALLGTSVTQSMITKFHAPEMIGWFDPDAAGDRGFLRLKKALELWPVNLGRINSLQEPKHTHLFDIKVRLEGLP